MEFKGTKGKWVESNDENKFESTIISGNLRICEVKSFGITTHNGGVVCKDPNIIERKANTKLIASAPEMFEDIKESITSLKILRNQIAFESKKSTQWIGMAETIDKWIEQKQQLLTKITG